ncbi:MAG: phosphate ABC transporter permease [Chloroflexi bacterium HGW-Chloroflexi-10]|nr:MAG: phosphate ABC transporter permease [Chloroflexi bacterium HGW-Chloroflexi-10]
MAVNHTQSPVTYLRPAKGLAALNLRDLWEYRELTLFLTWRDLKVRYKQTLLGFSWVILQPVINLVVFNILFGNLLNVPTDNIPYPIFFVSAYLPWEYFSGSLTRSSSSLVGSANLISKIYFPRMVIPISSVLSRLVDFAVSFIVLIVLMVIYKIVPTFNLLFLPLFLLLAMITALGVGLWLSALNVRFRDINYLVPFLVQIWMFVTPVIYGSSLIPEQFRFILGLNPMTGVVEGFRWAILGGQLSTAYHPGPLFIISIVITLIILVTGIFFFRNTERTFADVI